MPGILRHTQLTLSILVPCRNEGDFIGPCLDSILANDYPVDRFEILVLDGMSEDATRDIVRRYAQKYPNLKLVDNPQKTTPFALNLGIRLSRAEVLMRMDAHSVYAKSYIRKCVQALDHYSADCVGGIWKVVPRTRTLFGLGVPQALSHPFGVGNAQYRYVEGGEPRWVDTVPYFCMRKSRLIELGLFNEKLMHGQDMEFSLRLQQAGGRILLLPGVVSHYYARSDARSFGWHNWRNGVWALVPFAHSNIIPVAWRHLVPLVFVGSILGALVLGYWMPQLLWVAAGLLLSYGLVALAASVQIALREHDIRYVFVMPVVFVLLHVPYGLGSIWGLLQLLVERKFWGKLMRRESERRVA